MVQFQLSLCDGDSYYGAFIKFIKRFLYDQRNVALQQQQPLLLRERNKFHYVGLLCVTHSAISLSPPICQTFHNNGIKLKNIQYLLLLSTGAHQPRTGKNPGTSECSTFWFEKLVQIKKSFIKILLNTMSMSMY